MPLLTIPEEEASIRFAELILESGIHALLGYAVVFFGLILLMLVVILVGKAFARKPKNTNVGTGVLDGPGASSNVGTGVLNIGMIATGNHCYLKIRCALQHPDGPGSEPTGPAAPGAAGEVKLNNVDPKTAAMLMAIVADKMQKPINELRFISVKEVEQR